MPSTVKWGSVASFDEAVAGASMNALASGTAAVNYALGAAIDNTVGTMGALYGDLEIILSSAVTVGAVNTPFIGVYIIPSMDGGTTYLTTNGGTAAGPTSPNALAGMITVPPSLAVQVLQLRGIILPPFHFKIMINNQLQVALPASSAGTCRLRRYGEQGT